MKIVTDVIQDVDMFEALLDSFVSMSEIDEVEQNFINRLYLALREDYKNKIGTEDTQALIDKDLLL